MVQISEPDRQRFSATVAENGRVVIPAALRAALGIAGQRTEVFFDLRGDHLTLTTRMRELRRAQDRTARIAQTGGKLASDELIEDRRAEARRESGDT
ncbi:MAG: AbrB/MazE/SpoVT family DNA-binding domain-containing protein [Acidobacteriia bacterium]|nr:AbrB/MazE/SpoVT family DNA-binding domain-containing protein [Terriglobia bacterium]MYG03528.1 AbrB/MazE/SpoVT family DNA-binding domain-containing protein [Terriglobia bacterium]MYK09679.1 AbrB/MazE/SpoVT family DNA-binding domain-containing protein [Terriglobia bacterium]